MVLAFFLMKDLENYCDCVRTVGTGLM